MAWNDLPPDEDLKKPARWDELPPDKDIAEGYWEKTAKNIIPDITGMATGLGSMVKEGAYDMPKRALDTGLQMSTGIPYAETPSGKKDVELLKNAPQMTQEAIRPVTHPVDYFQEHPISQGLNALGLYGLGKAGLGVAGRGAGLALESTNLPETIGRVADNQMLKSTGAGIGQIKQIGPEAAREAAQIGREAGLGDVFSSEIGREQSLKNLQQTTGQKLGALRQEAGPASASVPDKIAADLESKYGTGGVYSGEAGGLKKALADVKRIAGGQPAELPVIAQGPKTGPLQALFDYNDLITGKSSYQIYGDPKLHGYGTTPNVPLETLQEKGIPVVGQTSKAAKLGQAPLDQLSAAPTHAGYAEAATHLNEYATGEKLKQPVNAVTDVANRLSHENNESILKALGPKAPEYTQALSDFKAYKVLEHFFERGELREMASRGGAKGLIQQAIQGMADKGGYRAVSKLTNALHEAMTEPLDVGEVSAKAMKSGALSMPAELSAYLEQKYSKKQ